MPIYEYECKSCGHRMEKLQKMSDDPLKQCPECNEDELKKLVSAAAFRLKGSGWYETDFKSGKKKNLHGAETTNNKSDAGSAPATKSDSGGSKKAGPKKESKSSSTSTSAKAKSK